MNQNLMKKNTSKFSIDTTNFNERTNNALTQQQDVIGYR